MSDVAVQISLTHVRKWCQKPLEIVTLHRTFLEYLLCPVWEDDSDTVFALQECEVTRMVETR